MSAQHGRESTITSGIIVVTFEAREAHAGGEDPALPFIRCAAIAQDGSLCFSAKTHCTVLLSDKPPEADTDWNRETPEEAKAKLNCIMAMAERCPLGYSEEQKQGFAEMRRTTERFVQSYENGMKAEINEGDIEERFRIPGSGTSWKLLTRDAHDLEVMALMVDISQTEDLLDERLSVYGASQMSGDSTGEAAAEADGGNDAVDDSRATQMAGAAEGEAASKADGGNEAMNEGLSQVVEEITTKNEGKEGLKSAMVGDFENEDGVQSQASSSSWKAQCPVT